MAGSRKRKFDALELERLLVSGEEAITDQGQPTIHYPSCRVLAARFGLAHSTVTKFAKDYDCLNRRELNRAKLQARIEQKLTERHAEILTGTRVEMVQAIDEFIKRFAEAVKNKQVRTESVTDFNVMARLREFLMGGADQRTEMQGQISLEALQARYQHWLQDLAKPTRTSAPQSTTSSTRAAPVDDLDDLKGLHKTHTTTPTQEQKQTIDATPKHQNLAGHEHLLIDHPIDHPVDKQFPQEQTPVRLARRSNHA